MSLAILNGLVDILGRTKSPIAGTIRKSHLLELSTQVNVRVAHRGGFSGRYLSIWFNTDMELWCITKISST